jgi:DMSO/TMAO reductase YedYZ heme-binding membrane subunit
MHYALPVAIVFASAIAAVAMTRTGRGIAAAVMRFMLFYAGVFALVTLTASVGVGLAATDRVVMSPGGRIIAQAVHRAASFAAVAFLAIHIAVEVIAGRSRTASAVVPFLDRGRTLYLGLGTVASDLVVLIIVTGLLRGRHPRLGPAWAWRALHALAYLGWPLAILHGLLAGRTAKPYVDWSYGACVAAVLLGLVIRFVAAGRAQETASSPVSGPPAWAGEPGPAALGNLYQPGVAGGTQRALPGPASHTPGAGGGQ